MDPLAFLAGHAPFSELSPAGFEVVASSLEIAYVSAGDAVFERGDPARYLHVLRKGLVRLEFEGQQVDELGPGEMCGLTAVDGEAAATRLDAIAERDCLLYRVPAAAARKLVAEETGFAAFFLSTLGERLRALTDASPIDLSGPIGTPVSELVRRAPISISPRATVAEAARRMRDERVGSLLVQDAGAWLGILTDRDLRGRVLAEDKGPTTPVGEVMSAPLATVPAELPLVEALLFMVEHGVHHLPVFDQGVPLGVLTHSDLLHHQQRSPALVLQRIGRARDVGLLARHADEMAELVAGLHRSGLPALEIGRVVSALNDAVVSRLCEWAEAALGPAPRPYAWLVFGSEGRHEQSFLTDQDNCLVYADGAVAEDEVYFERFATHVVEALVGVGFPRCEGGFMATNWRGDLSTWEARFGEWMRTPEPEALMRVANFFDFRRVHGGLSVEPLEELVRGAQHDQRFLAHLMRAGLEKRPPLGFARRVKEDEEGVDLKSGAIVPVVSLARYFALEAGARRGSTVQRLAAATRAGKLSAEGAAELEEAFRWVFALRLAHQLRQRAAGAAVGHHVFLQDLTPPERKHLKEAFLVVRRMQEAVSRRLNLDLFG